MIEDIAYEYDGLGNVVRKIYRDKKGRYVISEYKGWGVLTGKYIAHYVCLFTHVEDQEKRKLASKTAPEADRYTA